MSKYIASGTYGCVIKPNLNCNGTFGKSNTISKFFFDEIDYINEKNIHKKIENIDKKHEFTIKMVSSCKISLTPEIKKKINKLNLCDLKTDEIHQIIYEYGGYDLDIFFNKQSINFNKFNFYIFLQKFFNIFYGLSKLNKNDLIHFDIKINNILYNINKEKFHIIDFGLLISKSKLYTNHIVNSFKNNQHAFYPNDFNIISYINNGIFYKNLNEYKLNSDLFILFINDEIDIIKNNYKFNNNDPYLKEILDIYNYFKIDMFKNFDYKFFEKIFIKKIDINKLCKDIAGKLDVYMIGLALYEITIIIFTKFYNNPSIKKIPIELFSLIKKMLILNPCKRISIHKAKTEYKAIMKV
jgi:serine/threonine protein kinase